MIGVLSEKARLRIVYFFAGLVVGAAVFGGYVQRSNSKAIAGLRDAITEGQAVNTELRTINSRLTEQNTEHTKRVRELSDLNKQLERENSRARTELASVKDTLSTVARGLGEGADAIQTVIDGIFQIATLIDNVQSSDVQSSDDSDN